MRISCSLRKNLQKSREFQVHTFAFLVSSPWLAWRITTIWSPRPLYFPVMRLYCTFFLVFFLSENFTLSPLFLLFLMLCIPMSSIHKFYQSCSFERKLIFLSMLQTWLRNMFVLTCRINTVLLERYCMKWSIVWHWDVDREYHCVLKRKFQKIYYCGCHNLPFSDIILR